MRLTKVINIFGGPGAGKSTTAAELFARMKKKGYIVELVNEYAKDMTWENRNNILSDQFYMLAKQNRRLKRLLGKVDYIVTDSPLIMSRAYYADTEFSELTAMNNKLFSTYENVNFYLDNPRKDYSEIGRNQTLKEAKDLDDKILSILSVHYYTNIDVNKDTAKNIFKNIKEWH